MAEEDEDKDGEAAVGSREMPSSAMAAEKAWPRGTPQTPQLMKADSKPISRGKPWEVEAGVEVEAEVEPGVEVEEEEEVDHRLFVAGIHGCAQAPAIISFCSWGFLIVWEVDYRLLRSIMFQSLDVARRQVVVQDEGIAVLALLFAPVPVACLDTRPFNLEGSQQLFP